MRPTPSNRDGRNVGRSSFVCRAMGAGSTRDPDGWEGKRKASLLHLSGALLMMPIFSSLEVISDLDCGAVAFACRLGRIDRINSRPSASPQEEARPEY